MADKLRIAYLEEWPSLRANRILPYLAKQFDITYITSQKGTMPTADFAELIVFPPPKYINQRSLAFSRLADKLYCEGKIDFAVQYAGIAFLTRKVPILNFLGGSYFADFLLKWNEANLLGKMRLIIGFLHYSVPEFIACKRSRFHIVNSECLKQDLSHKYSLALDAISVAHNGIDEEFPRLGMKKKLPSVLQAVFVGRLHAGKGILKFVEAFTERKGISLDVLIAGDGPDYKVLEKISQDDSRITLLGHVTKEQLLRVMENTSIFIFPSLHEGCPNALLEAMAAKHACVCFDIPPVKEVLKDSGILVETEKYEHMCDSLEFLVHNREHIHLLAEKAFSEAGNFSWESCERKVGTVLEQFGRRCVG